MPLVVGLKKGKDEDAFVQETKDKKKRSARGKKKYPADNHWIEDLNGDRKTIW